MSLKHICLLVQQGHYRLTGHARGQMRSRQISVDDVELVITEGRVIETTVDEFGFDCYLILGQRFNGDEIHVAGKIVKDVFQVNTVYYPHEHLWTDDFAHRR